MIGSICPQHMAKLIMGNVTPHLREQVLIIVVLQEYSGGIYKGNDIKLPDERQKKCQRGNVIENKHLNLFLKNLEQPIMTVFETTCLTT